MTKVIKSKKNVSVNEYSMEQKDGKYVVSLVLECDAHLECDIHLLGRI